MSAKKRTKYSKKPAKKKVAKKEPKQKKISKEKQTPLAEKQNKPSKKPTTGGKNLSIINKDLPKSVRWLLDFANLGCKAGKLSIKNVYGEAKVKRPPFEPATLKKILFEYDCTAKILSNVDRLSIQKMNEIVAYVDKGIYSRKFLDVNDNEWLVTITGETIYCGNISDYPFLKEIKSFLLKAGISIDSIKNENISDVWFVAKASLCSMLDVHYLVKTYAQNFVNSYYNLNQIQLPKICIDDNHSLINGLKYTHDNTLFQVTCAYILDFWHNQRSLHEYLRQCKCCGKFWFRFKAKTRLKYCCKKCEDRFNQASRQANKDSQASRRKWKKQTAKKEIIDLLCNYGCTRKDAEEIYEKERKSHPENVANLKTYARRTNLI